jgi:hypothetical protein
MRWLFLLLLLSPGVARSDERHLVLVLSSGHGGEAVLVDALRIYTRDLGRTVRLGGRAPTTLLPEDLAQVAAEAGDAEVVVWFGEPRVLHALRVATLELRETPVEDEDPQQAARALALKVRALLTSREEAWTPILPSPTPTPSPTPSPTPVPIAVAPSPTPSPAPIVIAPKPRRVWLETTLSYGVMVPTNTDWVRHGLTLRVAIPLWRLSLFVDAAFTTAPTVTVDGSPVTGRIWPVGMGAVFRLERPKWRIAVGPRVSLQIVDAEAHAPNGQAGSAQQYSAGLGLLSEGVWKFSRYVAAIATISAELLVPRLQFAAGGAGSTDLGWVQFGFNAGLLISIP